MPLTVAHVKSVTSPDQPGVEINSSQWNQTHAVTYTPTGQEIIGAFSNTGDVSFSTGADSAVYGMFPGKTNYVAVSAATSLAGINFSGTNILGTLNSSGLSLSVNPGAQSQQPMYFSASGTSTSANTIAFGNSNGVSFSLSNGSLVATVKTDYQSSNANYLTSQSNQAFNASGGSSAFQTLSFSNANGITFSNSAGQLAVTHDLQYTSGTSAITSNAFPSANTTKFAGSGTTFAAANISGSMTLNSAGLNLSLSANVGGGADGYNAAQFTNSTANTTQPLVWAGNSLGSGNVTIGLTGSTITMSAPSGVLGGGVAVGAGGSTYTSGTVSFGNANSFSFLTSNGSVVGSYGDPDNWALYGNTAGTSASTIGTGGLFFAGGNNITLSGNSNTITIVGPTQSADANKAGTGFTTTSVAGVVVAGTHDTAGLKLAVPSYLTTALPTNAGVLDGFQLAGNTAGTTTSDYTTQDRLFLSGGNQITLSGNSNTVVISGPTAAGTGTTLAGSNLGVSATLNTAGLNLSLVNTDDHLKGWSLYGNTAGTSSTQYTTTGGLYLAGGANITLSGNSNTVTVVGPAPGGTTHFTMSRFDYPQQWQTGISSSGQTNANLSIVRLQIPQNIQFTRIEIPVSISASSSGASNGAAIAISSYGVLYTQNGSTLNPIVGAAGTQTLTWSSNSTGYSQLTGPRMLTFPIQSTLTPGEYFFGVQLSTTSAISSGTAATTALNATISMIIQSLYSANVWANWQSASAATSNNWVQGLNSVALTATNQTHQLSQMTLSGTAYVRAAIPVVFRQI